MPHSLHIPHTHGKTYILIRNTFLHMLLHCLLVLLCVAFAFPSFESQNFMVGTNAAIEPYNFFKCSGVRAWSEETWRGALQAASVAKELMQVCFIDACTHADTIPDTILIHRHSTNVYRFMHTLIQPDTSTNTYKYNEMY